MKHYDWYTSHPGCLGNTYQQAWRDLWIAKNHTLNQNQPTVNAQWQAAMQKRFDAVYSLVTAALREYCWGADIEFKTHELGYRVGVYGESEHLSAVEKMLSAAGY